MCITQLLKTLSFSNTLLISDSLLFFGNCGLVGLGGAGQEQAWDNPKTETGTALGDRPACRQCSQKKGIQESQSCCDINVLPQIFLRQGFSICILHFPCSYPITVFPLSFPCLLLLHSNCGYVYSSCSPAWTGWYLNNWNTKQCRQSSQTLNWEGSGSMDMCCLCSSAADKLPLLAMPVLVKQKLVQEAVTHLHLWCDHSKRHGSVSLVSLHRTASYMILQLFAHRALLNQVQWYCHISEPPTLLKPYTR